MIRFLKIRLFSIAILSEAKNPTNKSGFNEYLSGFTSQVTRFYFFFGGGTFDVGGGVAPSFNTFLFPGYG